MFSATAPCLLGTYFTAPSLQSYFQVSILHMNYSEHHAHFEKHKQNSADTSDRQLTIF